MYFGFAFLYSILMGYSSSYFINNGPMQAMSAQVAKGETYNVVVYISAICLTAIAFLFGYMAGKK